MSNGINKPSQRAQVRSITERVNSLEQNVTRFVWAVNQQLQQQNQRLAVIEETLTALVALAGEKEVQALVEQNRRDRAQAQVEEEKKSLDEGIADGYVTKTDKIEEKSLIVGRYLDAAGNVIEPGRSQLVVPGIAPEFREKLLGQGAGFSIDLPEGGKFEVQEIYAIDEQKANEILQAKQKPQEAPVAPAEEAPAVGTSELEVK